MNYSEPLVSQITVFFRALGCGVLLGILYGCVSALRMIFGERKGVYVFFDTAFFILAALISFFFMVLYNSGQVRLNLMLAELLGCTAFHFSFGRYILEKYALYLHRIRTVISFLMKPFVTLYSKFLSVGGKILSVPAKKYAEGKFFNKNLKKLCDISKILLKNKNKSV